MCNRSAGCLRAVQVVSLGTNILSRRYEFQADSFAVSLGHAEHLKGALRKLDAKNRSAQNVDPYYSAYHYSHPPLIERLRAIEAESDHSDTRKTQ